MIKDNSSAQNMGKKKRQDKQMLDTILSIMTKCNYPQEYQIYYIVTELAQRGYVELTDKSWVLGKSKTKQYKEKTGVET